MTRFEGEFPVSLEEKRGRLLDFADFLDGLKPSKFDHTDWCDPDHTCKTTACGGGWAALLYSEQAKIYIENIYERQRKCKELEETIKEKNQEVNSVNYEILIQKVTSLRSEYDNILVPKEPSWHEIGQKVLGLSVTNANKLFTPINNFWEPIQLKNEKKRKSGDEMITAKQFALVIRYLAHTPNCDFYFHPSQTQDNLYNERYFKKYIKENPVTM